MIILIDIDEGTLPHGLDAYSNNQPYNSLKADIVESVTPNELTKIKIHLSATGKFHCIHLEKSLLCNVAQTRQASDVIKIDKSVLVF